jgi:hypothetical protein
MKIVFNTLVLRKSMFHALALALLWPVSAAACSLCGCGDSMEASGQGLPRAGQWRLGLDWEQLSARAASDEDPARTEGLSQLVLAPTLSYSPSNALNLALRLPWNQKSWDGGEEGATGVSAGLGDLDLGLRWFFARGMDMAARSTRFAALTLGSTLNTGPSQLEDAGARIDEHAQPGSGAMGPYAGILLGGTQGDWKLVLHAGGYGHATNFSGYAYGPALKAGLGLRCDTSPATAVGIALEGRYADYDRSGGELVLNSGGSLAEMAPSFHLKFGERVGLSFKALLPVYANLSGEQQVGAGFLTSLQYILN